MTHNPNDDLIRRGDVLAAFWDWKMSDNDSPTQFQRMIDTLPAVQPRESECELCSGFRYAPDYSLPCPECSSGSDPRP